MHNSDKDIYKRIELIQGDITQCGAEGIVNAANNSLLGGGGVDGAIHQAAGPELLEECKTLNGCMTGEAKITDAYNIPSRKIIHTVGPVWKGGHRDEMELISSAYRKSLELATEYKLQSLAFPNISTGIYGFPKELAAEIAIRTVAGYLQHHSIPEKVLFVSFNEENYALYEKMRSR